MVAAETGALPAALVAARRLTQSGHSALVDLGPSPSWLSDLFDPEFGPNEARRDLSTPLDIFPSLDAEVSEADIGDLLESGAVHMAIGLISELESGFYQQALFDQDWVCVANARHPRLDDGLTIERYRAEAHIGIVSGTGHALLESALDRHGVDRRVVMELPGFLGMAAIVGSTDLIATLPRQSGEMLARINGLTVFPCPVPIPSFTVKQHWHARYHHDAASRWLRGVCVDLFQTRTIPGGGGIRRDE